MAYLITSGRCAVSGCARAVSAGPIKKGGVAKNLTKKIGADSDVRIMAREAIRQRLVHLFRPIRSDQNVFTRYRFYWQLRNQSLIFEARLLIFERYRQHCSWPKQGPVTSCKAPIIWPHLFLAPALTSRRMFKPPSILIACSGGRTIQALSGAIVPTHTTL